MRGPEPQPGANEAHQLFAEFGSCQFGWEGGAVHSTECELAQKCYAAGRARGEADGFARGIESERAVITELRKQLRSAIADAIAKERIK